MYSHISEYLAQPALVRINDHLTVARFESMKVASAAGAVDALEKSGTIRPGDTLVDSSSGIYAHALALVAHARGYRCHIIASITVDATLKAQLAILGATCEQVPSESSLELDQKERVRRVGAFLEAHPDAHWMQQYHDRIHYLGYEPIADMIHRELAGAPLTIVAGVGSGASTGGLVARLRALSEDVRLVGVQPFGSVSFGSEHVDDPQIIIAGIGSAIEFRNIDYPSYDEIDWVGFDYARTGAINLLGDTGIFAGLSTGANYLVASHLTRQDPSRQYLMIAADTGHRYVEKVYQNPETALPIGDLTPRTVDSLDELSTPWCVMEWAGRPFTVGTEK